MSLRDERGVALVLALAVIALLCSLMVDFSYTMMVDLSLAANLRDEQKAFYAARTGIEVAKHLLQEDDTEYDALDEDWAHFDEHPGFLSEDDEGRFHGTIEDEAGKFPINTLISGDDIDEGKRLQLERLFEVLELDLDLIFPICDWLDSNHDEGPNGAEDAYYAELSPPYPCKDGPLSSLEELLLAKGMTEEILYGTEEKKGLIHYLTIYSNGKININTASAEVLQCLSDDIEEDLAQAIVDYLREEPFKKEEGQSLCEHIEHLGMKTDTCEELQDQCEVKSSIYSVCVEGQVRGIKKRIVTVLNRSDKAITPLFWRVE
jgi:general secretion pathway protein K